MLFGCDDGNAYCLSRTTGELIWKFNPSLEKAAEQRRLINNDRLISYFPIRTGVTVRDGVAYFGASFLPWRESYICAVDVETGMLSEGKHTFVERHEDATLEGSLLVAEDRLLDQRGSGERNAAVRRRWRRLFMWNLAGNVARVFAEKC